LPFKVERVEKKIFYESMDLFEKSFFPRRNKLAKFRIFWFE
jgi:hypothetical protein